MESAKQLDGKTRMIEESVSRLDKNFEGKIRDLSGKTELIREYAANKNDELEQQLRSACAEVDARSAERADAANRAASRQDTERTKVVDQLAATETYLKTLDERTMQQHERVMTACSHAEESVTMARANADANFKETRDRITDTQTRIQKSGQEMEGKLASSAKLFDTKVQECNKYSFDNHEKLAGICDKMQGDIDSSWTELASFKNQVVIDLQTIRDSTNERLGQQQSAFTATCSELEFKFGDLYTSTDASIVAVAKDINATIGAHVQRLDDSLVNTDKTLDEMAAKLQGVDNAFTLHKTDAEANLRQTNKDWTAKCGELDTLAKDNQRSIAERCNRTEKALAADTATTRSKIEQCVQANLVACGKVDEKLIVVKDEHDRRLIELTSRITGQVRLHSALPIGPCLLICRYR